MATNNLLNIRAALRHLRRVDGPMAALIAHHGAPPFTRTRNSLESLGRAIVYQQLSGKAAGTIYGRFLDLFPSRRFPRPELLLAKSVPELRAVGLSRGKATYLRDLARCYADGIVNPRVFRTGSDEAIREMLLEVKGIGQWSVDMFMMFGLNRPDVLPVGDLGVRRGAMVYFNLDEPPPADELIELAQPWRPYRSVAGWYMYRCAEEGIP